MPSTTTRDRHIEAPLPAAPVIFGTAGHIDHGKSALVKALTGTDPDRLREEQERGITIDLGYAFLGPGIAIIDVPGHERFIKNMVAGAATVDFALIVIAADDGVMPQTREHLDILQLLGCTRGIVAVTKADKVDEEWLELITDDIRRYLQQTPFGDAGLYVCDSLSGKGIPDLHQALLELAQRKMLPSLSATFFMPVDRSFVMKGHGAVATGSVLSGQVQPEALLELLPPGRTVRVRRLQSHGREAPRCIAGQRAAVNLADIAAGDIRRGMVLATPGTVAPGQLLDVRLSCLASGDKPVLHRQRVRLHVGTAEVMARVSLLQGDRIAPGTTAFAQAVLEKPVAARRGHRFVIRSYSPARTIGGGVIIDTRPAKHRRNCPGVIASLQALGDGSLAAALVETVNRRRRITPAELARAMDMPAGQVQAQLAEPLERGDVLLLEKAGAYASGKAYQSWLDAAARTLASFHALHPLLPGMKRQELLQKAAAPGGDPAQDFLEAALAEGRLRAHGHELVALGSFEVRLNEREAKLVARIESLLHSAGFQPPSAEELAAALGQPDAGTLLEFLVSHGRVVCLQGKFFFHAEVLSGARRLLQDMLARQDAVGVGQIRERLSTSRKWIIPLAGYFDAMGWTTRVGEQRIAGPKLHEP